MAVYNISYDLNAKGQKYDELIKYIQSFDGWCHFLDSHWWVRSNNKNANRISEEIAKILDENDRWQVMRAHKDYEGALTRDKWDWLNGQDL
jgi:hypothetical protein